MTNKRGNYSFLKGIAPYSAGVVADKGFEVVHVRFLRYVPLRAGFAAVDAHLREAGLPAQAMCAMQLRSPKPFTFAGFEAFNAGYVDFLKQRDILVDGLNPIARTNVAPELSAPAEPSVYGFSYTKPSKTARKTFVVAGAGELPDGSLDPHDVVRRGESSAAAIREKIRFVMGRMEARLKGLGADWSDITVTEIYTVHDIRPFLEDELLKRIGVGATHGLTWHYARPPLESLEYEMDLRGCATELVI
ncbi:MAG TPA: hypothetical protein VKT81_13530 [Bryobacteraceae bacterium]|nr:hypothetical protein [Bryobacteraceae bacterium]